MKPGDLVIIATFCQLEEQEAKSFEPTVLLVDDKTKLSGIDQPCKCTFKYKNSIALKTRKIKI